uniref:Uncharacterized protein n=1 Tax=Schistocephalus solidus TaxID=70667 RepID=A0A0V0J7A4_SCHSO
MLCYTSKDFKFKFFVLPSNLYAQPRCDSVETSFEPGPPRDTCKMDSVECRRSLNTTPTSPPAALLTDDEEKEIKVTKISASSSITRRRAQYDYVFQKSASTGNQKASQSTPPARHSTLQQVGLPTLIAVVILICGFIFITRSVWYWADKRSNTNWRQSVRELKRSYPGQDSRLWTVIQSAMQTLLCEGSRFPMAPLVILLLPNSPFAKATDQQSALPAKFADFIQNLSQVLAQLNSAGNQDCVPLNVSDLTSHPHDEKRQPTVSSYSPISLHII